MIKFWKDTFRNRSGWHDSDVALQTVCGTAATFAEIIVEGRPYSDMFTATSNTARRTTRPHERA
jgi:hypothetical protein